jgi:hypothetical protein
MQDHGAAQAALLPVEVAATPPSAKAGGSVFVLTHAGGLRKTPASKPSKPL